MTEMTEERLANHRKHRDHTRGHITGSHEKQVEYEGWLHHAEVVDEIDRLLAELAAVTEERDRLRSLNLDVSPEPAP